MSRTIIAPSILAANLANLTQDTRKILTAGADWVHVDIMDGHFVPNLSFGPPVVKCLKADISEAFLDCHLMVTNPAAYLAPLQKAGAGGFTFHWEAFAPSFRDSEFRALLHSIRSTGMRTGVALKPTTEVPVQLRTAIQEKLVDLVLVMTVEPGFGGQSFMPEPLRKVRELRTEFPELDIEVDGGITIETVPATITAGANVFVSGTGVFAHPHPQEAITTMRNLAAKSG